MSLIEAIILGLLQGLTEFLPVSSSGHIELGKAVFGLELKEALLFTVVLHFATALSTVIVFWKDIVGLVRTLFSFKWNEDMKYIVFIIISMIPASLVGLLLKDWIEEFFDSNVFFVSLMLLITGVVLFVSDRMKKVEGSVTGIKAAVLGIVQAIAILPGISRSGSTIASAVIMGIDRTKAARFSFIMVLPLIFAAMGMEMLDLKEVMDAGGTVDIEILPTMVGFIVALISGYMACKWMIKIVQQSKLSYFAYYCWIVGAVGVGYSLLG